MANIYLTGFMGSGKTTVGKILAHRIHRSFIEMDSAIEKKEGRSIKNIFKYKGEPYFRALEKKLLKEISKKRTLVVSCGGGIVCDNENTRLMRATGKIVNLYAPAYVLWQRIKKAKNRPLLNLENPLKEIRRLLKKRESYYKKARYFINTRDKTPEEIAQDIIAVLKTSTPQAYSTSLFKASEKSRRSLPQSGKAKTNTHGGCIAGRRP